MDTNPSLTPKQLKKAAISVFSKDCGFYDFFVKCVNVFCFLVKIDYNPLLLRMMPDIDFGVINS
jgi:hypothetical protein